MIQILDCTLRDGGYINNWNFGEKKIKSVISYLHDANINIVECGYLNDKTETNCDRTIFNSFEQMKSMSKGIHTEVVGMINYGEYDINLIPCKNSSTIDGVRVVFRKNEWQKAIKYCQQIKEKGYSVFVQPMATINYKDEELLQLIKQVNLLIPEALYIVDSFGVMKKNDLLRIFYLLNNNLNSQIKIGYHAHNNLQLAYSNAQAFVEVHSSRNIIIDASVQGMGRGAGNLNTELFVQYLNEQFGASYNVHPLLKIIDETTSIEHEKNYWGYSLPHYLSALYNCHPNYASYLAEKNTLNIKAIQEILEQIDLDHSQKFNKDYIEEIYLNFQENYINDMETKKILKQKLQGHTILIIAPGKSIEKYEDEIQVISNLETTITVNVNFVSDQINPDYVFISNEKRLEKINEFGYVGEYILTSNLSNTRENVYYINYTDLLNLIDDVADNATLMLLKLLTKFQVKEVILAGFDGYIYSSQDNYINADMALVFPNSKRERVNQGVSFALKQLTQDLSITFLTPSIYEDSNLIGTVENE